MMKKLLLITLMLCLLLIAGCGEQKLLQEPSKQNDFKHQTLDIRYDRPIKAAYAKRFDNPPLCPAVLRWLKKQSGVIHATYTPNADDCRYGCADKPTWHVRQRVSIDSVTEYDLTLGTCDWAVLTDNSGKYDPLFDPVIEPKPKVIYYGDPGKFGQVGVASDDMIQEQLENLFPPGSRITPRPSCDKIDTWLRNHNSVRNIVSVFIAEMDPPHYSWAIEYLDSNLRVQEGVVGSMCAGEISKKSKAMTTVDGGRIKGYLYDRLVAKFPLFATGTTPNKDWPTCTAISEWLGKQSEVTSQKFKGVFEVLFQYGEWDVTFRDGMGIQTGKLKGSCT